MPARDEILNWLAEARADLKHCKVSIDAGDYSWACFAAQQAAEKALKSIILHLLGIYPRSHDLVKLYRVVAGQVDLGVKLHELATLSAYYTQAKYPNAGLERPSEEMTKEQAEQALKIAEGIVNEVSKIIGGP